MVWYNMDLSQKLRGVRQKYVLKLHEVRKECVLKLHEVRKEYVLKLRRFIAEMWGKWYKVHFEAKNWSIRYGFIATVAVAVLVYLVGLYFLSEFHSLGGGYFDSKERLGDLRTLFVSIGGALVGASAIAFSFVMFVMQVNVERLPHGLFRIFNTDGQIVGAFVGTIFCSITVASFSLIPDASWVANSLYNSFWAIFLIFVLFLHAYKRTLKLINPTKQLGMMNEMTRKVFDEWVKRNQRARSFFESQDDENNDDGIDYERAAYFQLNTHWINEGVTACNYALAFARKYTEMGDYDVVRNAHIALVDLNAAYVEAKGATFFAHNLLIDNPNVHDEFISNTLEQLRQSARNGIKRGDEKQIEQTMETLAALVGVYSSIEYSRRTASKTHANLAAGYLGNAVQEVIAHDMADVLMNGARLLGKAARVLAQSSGPNSVTLVTGKIGIVGMAGFAKKEYSPVTNIAIEQFRDLSLFVVINCEQDTDYALKDITSYVSILTKTYITQPNADVFGPLLGGSLAAYYSPASQFALLGQFSSLVNSLLDQPANDEASIRVLNSIRIWSGVLSGTQREIFQTALEKKSSFCIEFVMWVTSMVQAFLVASNSPACQEPIRDSIRENAYRLLTVFSTIPDELDTIRFIENSQVTDNLFSAAFDSWKRDCHDFSRRAQTVFIRWVFMAGKHMNGWAILEKGLHGLCVLAIIQESAEAVDDLLGQIDEYSVVLAQDKKDDAARNLRREAQELGRPNHAHTDIGFYLHQVDPEQGKDVMTAVANRISPDTVDEPIERPLLFHGD